MFIRKSHVVLWSAVFPLAVFCGSMTAQLVTASLQGTVTDPSGGVVPSARVEITNISTNVKTTELLRAEKKK